MGKYEKGGIDSFIFRSHGWSKRGQAIYGGVSGKRFYRESFIAAKRSSEFLPLYVFKEHVIQRCLKCVLGNGIIWVRKN